MRIITKKRIHEFSDMHADAEQSLLEWYHTTKNCDWQNFAEMRDTFGSVDSAGNDRFVFNIKGNHYRLVAIVIFAARKVFIRFIGTHAEYDKINASTV